MKYFVCGTRVRVSWSNITARVLAEARAIAIPQILQCFRILNLCSIAIIEKALIIRIAEAIRVMISQAYRRNVATNLLRVALEK